ncbi:hypothetical protein [Mycetocola zhadangensis]|uniref:DUF3137 domain-containing protein n=1 Tax=Mycetocola zhadangensis TaxID=1164595 RepID=A0A3L7J0L6_9MICO|nr:hypothetical protein [Mycetocola zhadangensis]RLQ83960.1 hypothetical protein D9V28_06830 [Mycetocola zhadangensis]GGE97363.1 hypothetical protein GCM10011313_20490 [Mycetocola zhadangensis]
METMEEAGTSLRTDALTSRLRRRDVRAFYRAFAQQYPSVRDPAGTARRIIVSVGWVVAPVGLLAMSVGISSEIEEAAPDMVKELVAMAAICGLFVYAGVLLCWTSFRMWKQRGNPERHYRLATFAHENGMSYVPGPIPGAHLTPWQERGELALTRVMRPISDPPIEFANYLLDSGTSKSRNSNFGGICSIKLPLSLPHIVLRAKDGRPDLASAAPAGSQALSLEGNFDNYFTLYCPRGYEQDALYLFTPDVMATLIDRVNGFDVEIIDDWLFLESSRDVVTTNPETWHNVVTATTALTQKVERWVRWRDTRVPATSAEFSRAAATLSASMPRVAQSGRRLRMGLGGGAILAAVLGAAYVIAVLVANSLG